MLQFRTVVVLTTLVMSCYGFTLPAPTGKYNVALTQKVIQHTTPNDPFAPSGTGRSFLVNIWYPTLQEAGSSKRAAYDRPLATLYEDYFNEAYNISTKGVLTGITAAVQYSKAPPLPPSCESIKLPTLLFQPPFTGPPSQGFTSLLSDLASRGYTIVALDHPYEQPFIQYPNGGPGFYGQPVDYSGDYTTVEKYNSIRLSDAEAFFNAWPSLVAECHAQKAFNTTHFVALGHSIGGSVSINELLQSQRKNRQILGGVDLDGSLLGKAGNNDSSADTKRPTLFMSSMQAGDDIPGWADFGAQQSAWWRYFEVNGNTTHTDYSDIILWKQLLGITKPGPYKIEATRMVDLVRSWVAGFVDKVTTGNRNTVVEGRSKRWPEVKLIAAKN